MHLLQKSKSFICSFKKTCRNSRRSFADYVQGQYFNSKTREYFYYIDHQGQLFLDDAKVKNFISCFQDKEFLAFFFKRVKLNTTGRYEVEFPYLSPCGRERNYIRCDDFPIVFTHMMNQNDETGDHYYLSCNNTGNKVIVPFSPEKLRMLPESLRVYHPASERVGGIGLVKSKLAIELSQYFEYDIEQHTDEEFLTPPTCFTWKGIKYELTNELLHKARSTNSE